MANTDRSVDASKHSGEVTEDSCAASELLRQVLQATLRRDQYELSEVEWDLFQQVAHSPTNRDLGVEEFTLLLVRIILSSRFPTLSDNVTLERMCARISHSLSCDPTAAQRMKNLWLQIQESAQ